MGCSLNVTFYSNPTELGDEEGKDVNFAAAFEILKVCHKHRTTLPNEVYDFFCELYQEEIDVNGLCLDGEKGWPELVAHAEKSIKDGVPYDLSAYGVLQEMDTTSCIIDVKSIPAHVKTIKVSYE